MQRHGDQRQRGAVARDQRPRLHRRRPDDARPPSSPRPRRRRSTPTWATGSLLPGTFDEHRLARARARPPDFIGRAQAQPDPGRRSRGLLVRGARARQHHRGPRRRRRRPGAHVPPAGAARDRGAASDAAVVIPIRRAIRHAPTAGSGPPRAGRPTSAPAAGCDAAGRLRRGRRLDPGHLAGRPRRARRRGPAGRRQPAPHARRHPAAGGGRADRERRARPGRRTPSSDDRGARRRGARAPRRRPTSPRSPATRLARRGSRTRWPTTRCWPCPTATRTWPRPPPRRAGASTTTAVRRRWHRARPLADPHRARPWPRPSGFLSVDVAVRALRATRRCSSATRRCVRRGTRPRPAVDGQRVLFASRPRSRAAVPVPGAPLSELALRQRFLAEAAVRLLFHDRTPLLVGAPGRVRARPRRSASGPGLDAPWLELTDTDDLGDGRPLAARRDRLPGRAGADRARRRELHRRRAADRGRPHARQRAAAQRRGRGPGPRRGAHLALLRRPRPGDRVARATPTPRSPGSSSRLERMRIRAPRGVTLSSATGSFATTVTNRLDQPVTRLAAHRSASATSRSRPPSADRARGRQSADRPARRARVQPGRPLRPGHGHRRGRHAAGCGAARRRSGRPR